MTREETKDIMAMLITAYPYLTKQKSNKDMSLMVDLWASSFVTVPYEIVQLAIKKLIATSTFAPSIAEVRAKIGHIKGEAVEQLLMGNIDMIQAERLKAIAFGCSAIDREPSIISLIEERRPSIEASDQHQGYLSSLQARNIPSD